MSSEDEEEAALISASEDEDDDGKHARLLDAISGLDGKKINKKNQRTVPTSQVSEFTFSNAGDDSKVKLHELVGTFKTSASHSTLKKQLRSAEKQKVVSVPLPKHEKQKIERSVAYKKVKEEVSKWDPIVYANRQADQLQFPLQKSDLIIHNNTNKFKAFKPRTPLEMEIAALLKGNPDVPSNAKELTPSEEKALAAMSLEEARERRAELQKYRALMSYKEAKAKRQKRIKSKKYHRILKKEKMKKEKVALEEMEKNDPEAYAEKMQEVERSRMEERMSLKHRGGSKYARKQMMYAKYDDHARQRVQDMLQKSRELTQKTVAVSDSDDNEEVVQEMDDEAMIEKELSSLSSNPWMNVHSSQKLESHYQKPDVLLNSHVKEQVQESDESGDESDDGEEDLLKKMGKKLERNSSKVKNIDDIFQKLEDSEKKTALEANNKTDEVKNVNSGKKPKKNRKRRKRMVKNDKIEKRLEEEEDEALIYEGLHRRKNLEDIEVQSSEGEETSAVQTNTNKRGQGGDLTMSNSDKVEEVYVDPKKLFTLESKITDLAHPDVVARGDEEEDNEETQRMTIAQAFADDDVIDEFIKEKDSVVDQDKPKDIDLFLPGWGSWGGEGIVEAKKKRKRFIIKAPEGPPRKDHNLGNVIISEQKDQTISKYQVSELPFPYVSVKQFEQSIRAPVGKTWNPETAVKELVKPKVVTKLGTVINPISKADVFKKGQKKRKTDIDVESSATGPKKRKQKAIRGR